MAERQGLDSTSHLKLERVHIAGKSPSSLWDVNTLDGAIKSIDYHGNAEEGQSHPLLLPSLCHPHIHLDKAFLLSSNNPRYEDLVPQSGTFKEALQNTSKAKDRYTLEDLLLRGSQLIAESIQWGVTAMRAFVEIDHAVGMKCLQTGIELKQNFRRQCLVQIVAFAQDPVFSGEHGEENKLLMEEALMTEGVDVLGTTPYVESDLDAAVKNIQWAVQAALSKNCHLDFHLDYNVDRNAQSMVWIVIKTLRESRWAERSKKTIVLGHCTNMTLFSDEEMTRLAHEIQEASLSISFVGLPTSDIYMMGRPSEGSWGGQKPRATLQVPSMIQNFGLNAAIGVNNVGNAFTPWGSCDPLTLACMGVGLYHAGSKDDVELLYACVSTRAKAAIGVPTAASVEAEEGDVLDFVLYRTAKSIEYSGGSVPARVKRTLHDVVWDPPPAHLREVVYHESLADHASES